MKWYLATKIYAWKAKTKLTAHAARFSLQPPQTLNIWCGGNAMMMQPLSHHLGKGGPLSEAHAWRDRQLVVRYLAKSFWGCSHISPSWRWKKIWTTSIKKGCMAVSWSMTSELISCLNNHDDFSININTLMNSQTHAPCNQSTSSSLCLMSHGV